MNDLVILAASAVGVLAMIGVALALGFRQRTRVDLEELTRLAAAENAVVDASVADGAGGIARLGDGRWLSARVMADGVGARVFAPQAVRVRAVRGGLRIMFDDVGYPALVLKLSDAPPAWLMERAA